MATAVCAFSPAVVGQGKPPAVARRPLAETLPEAARIEYQGGKILFDDGDYATALQKFKSAYAKQTDARLLYNIAACEKNLRHYTKASRLFHQYLLDGRDLITPQDRRETEELLKVIDALTTPVTITVSEEGARITLDDEPIGTSPIVGTTVLDIGQRKLRVEKDGFRTIAKVVQIDPGTNLDFKLEKQRGGLDLTTQAGATVTLDGKPVGTGPVIKADDLPIGGHALRIEAPRMRPYQGEVVLEDDKTRTLKIELESDPEQFAEIRVAVGCTSQAALTPDKGLAVYLDGSEESTSSLGARNRVEKGEEATAYVPFSVTPGSHTVRVRIPSCEPLETTVVATSASPGVVSGALPPLHPFFNGSPAGSPNRWRVGAGFSYSVVHFGDFQYFFPGTTLRSTSANLALAGPVISGGTQSRWFLTLLEARLLRGSSTGTQEGVTNSVIGPVSQAGSFTTWDLGVRFGPRFPLYVASLSLGGEGALGGFTASPEGASSNTAFMIRGAAWASLDAQPLCDFTFGVGPHVGFRVISSSSSTGSGNGQTSSDFGVFAIAAWVPNTLCDRKRNGEFRLQSSSGAGTAAASPPSPQGGR